MKKLLIALVVLVLVLAGVLIFVLVGNKEGEAASSSSESTSLAESSSSAVVSESSSSSSSAVASSSQASSSSEVALGTGPVMQGLTAVAYPEDVQAGMQWEALYAPFSDLQKEMIVMLVNSVIGGYHDGTLPYEVVPNSEFFINDPLPEGATLPTRVAWNDLALEDFDDYWQQKVSLSVGNGNTMVIFLNNTHWDEGGHFMVVAQVLFE